MITRRSRALLGIGIGGVALVGWAIGLSWWFWDTDYFPVDSGTYLLAGIRLNHGGALYDLRPTDFWFPYAERGTALWSPPLMGVIARLIATSPQVFLAWFATIGAATIWAVLVVLRATGGWAGLALIAIVGPITLLVGVGNVDGLVLAALVAAWFLGDRSGGILIGVAASLKLTPATVVVWLIVSKRWRALRWTVATGIILALLAMLVVEPGIFVRYVSVMQEGVSTGHSWSLLVVAIGIAMMILFRGRPDLTYVIAVALMPLGSPQAAGHSWAMIVAATPAMWVVVNGLARWLVRRVAVETRGRVALRRAGDLQPAPALVDN